MMKSSELPIDTTGSAGLAMLAAAPQGAPAGRFRPEAPGDAAAIDAIHEATFGPGRFARTAFRLREGVAPVASLSLVAEFAGSSPAKTRASADPSPADAFAPGAIVGSVRLTPITIGEAVPALLLGPLAVLPALKNQGIGKALMRRSMEAARLEGHRLVVLVGDLPYYWPFGFRTVPQGRLHLPGPVDPARLLVAELVAGAFDGVAGAVRSG